MNGLKNYCLQVNIKISWHMCFMTRQYPVAFQRQDIDIASVYQSQDHLRQNCQKFFYSFDFYFSNTGSQTLYHNHIEDWLKQRLLCLRPRVSESKVRDGSLKFAFLTGSQLTLILLVFEKYYLSIKTKGKSSNVLNSVLPLAV